MAHKLTFKDPDLFRFAFEGFYALAKGTNRNENRLIEKILQHFESISMEEPELTIPGFDPKDKFSPKIRYLDTTRDGVVIFEDAEFEFFKRTLESIAAPAVLARTVNRLYDFVDAAQKGDAKTLAQAG